MLLIADNTCIVVADKDPLKVFAKVQTDFDTLLRWCHDPGLVLNSNKAILLVNKSPFQQQSITSALIARTHSCLHKYRKDSCSCTSIEI